mmetsp:Transcript_135243/g.238475  ORF Transcript_135243/g.238475 Transcript_135243/m.238475 type:complete len:275 (-) Transcript_135243:1176-2000(-)
MSATAPAEHAWASPLPPRLRGVGLGPRCPVCPVTESCWARGADETSAPWLGGGEMLPCAEACARLSSAPSTLGARPWPPEARAWLAVAPAGGGVELGPGPGVGRRFGEAPLHCSGGADLSFHCDARRAFCTGELEPLVTVVAPPAPLLTLPATEAGLPEGAPEVLLLALVLGPMDRVRSGCVLSSIQRCAEFLPLEDAFSSFQFDQGGALESLCAGCGVAQYISGGLPLRFSTDGALSVACADTEVRGLVRARRLPPSTPVEGLSRRLPASDPA